LIRQDTVSGSIGIHSQARPFIQVRIVWAATWRTPILIALAIHLPSGC
jgi:hypothetical protein